MKADSRSRLDALLVSRGHFSSRERARSAVLEGSVSVEGQRIDKPGQLVRPDCRVVVKTDHIPYVGRGGLKLQWALDVFGVSARDKVALDVGASTGGFTDCLLTRGANKVYAVDVGYGQLAWTLRTSPKVVVMERTNARYLGPDSLGERVHLATIDVSFISLRHMFGPVSALTVRCGHVLALVKPQFEAGRTKVPKRGVIKDVAVQEETLERVASCARECGLMPIRGTHSPIKGAKGNVEFWIQFQNGGTKREAGADVGHFVSITGNWAQRLTMAAAQFFQKEQGNGFTGRSL